MLILLAACSDFRRKTSREGSRERLEAVKDADDTLLLGEGRDGKLDFLQICDFYINNFYAPCVLFLLLEENFSLEKISNVFRILMVRKNTSVSTSYNVFFPKPSNGFTNIFDIFTCASNY